MEQLLEFEAAFPTEEKLSFVEYLAGTNRSHILNTASFFLGFKNHNSEFDDNKTFLEMYFRNENNALANEIYERIKVFERQGARVVVVNPFSSLNLFEYYFSKPDEEETQSGEMFEISLLKAYLSLNSEFTAKQSIAFPSAQKAPEELIIPMTVFCMQYPVSDKYNYNIKEIWATQIIKAIYLFEFLESNNRTKPLLAAFLSYFESGTWQEYLKNLLPLTMPAIQIEKEAHTDIVVTAGEKFQQGCDFIEKLIVHENDELDQNDFLTLRGKPFYKVKEGVYRIIYNLFVVEKIFKGVYFLLRDINKTLPRADKIPEIRSFYGDEFSEKILCYKVIESIYPHKCIRFSGKQLTDMHIDAGPDYYIRKGKNIVIVESKDFLIPADKKMSFDYSVYEQEFGRILDYEELDNGKIKNKAVMQLIGNIRKLLNKSFKADTGYHYRDVFIYPVLLTHDHQYDTPGFNELIDYWFQDALRELKEEGLFIHHVKPISVVNIDSLIYNQVGLTNEMPLHDVLHLYHENKKVEHQKNRNFKNQMEYERYMEEYKQMRLSKLVPFSIYIGKYFHKRNWWKPPPVLQIVSPALFKEELTE